MKITKSLPVILAACLLTAPALAADSVRIVGSSTVFPFSTAVAEQFHNKTGTATPVVESTGTGGGFKLFCAINGPDITNASRQIKKSEADECTKNGVVVQEYTIGYDGIVIAQSKDGKEFSVTVKQLYLALAKSFPKGYMTGNYTDTDVIPNPNKTWKDVDASFPDTKIEVLGPPPTSGTRDAFVELAMDKGCKQAQPEKMGVASEENRKAICQTIREDGAYIEAGENDNLIVQKLEANPNALGIFGYSFLEQNGDKLRGITVEKVAPTVETIADSTYPLSRPLFFYVNKERLGHVPGLEGYIKEFMSDAAIGPDGYLIDKGLIPLQ